MIFLYKYKIADLIVEFKGEIHDTVLKKCEPYLCSDDLNTDVSVNISFSDERFNVENNENTYGSGDEFWEQTDGHIIEYLLPDNDAKFLVKIDYYDSGKTVDVYMFDAKKHYGSDDTYYLSNTLSILFHYLALLNNRLVLHSSSVCADGYGVAFSADSGVGKSTHTSLWIKHVPGCEYINDDTPVIYNDNGQIFIYGSPFAGSTGINTNVKVPLKAIVFLKRGVTNSIKKLDTQSALPLMFKQLVQPLAGNYLDKLIPTLSDILSVVPVYELHCNIEFDAVKTSYEEIFNKQLKNNI